jgi:FKBP-type peptidyl-prolyl cis-trans isomerase
MESYQPIPRLKDKKKKKKKEEKKKRKEEEEEKKKKNKMKKKTLEITSTGLYLNMTNIIADNTCVRTSKLICSP